MSTTNMAQVSRTIHFRSKGGSYDAVWMSDKGDLYQEYQQNGSTVTYYPDFASSPRTMNLTVTSARTTGTVTPVSVDYYANGTKLTFDLNTCECTNPGWKNVFAITNDASRRLRIIGNLGVVVLSSFMMECRANVTGVSGSDVVVAQSPATLLPYTGADSARVTIAPGDEKNYTITEKGGYCILKAITTKGGNEVPPAGLTYAWYKLSATGWTLLSATTQSITVKEEDVDTSATYKVVVKESGATLGEDITKVLDASDPYDILVSTKVSPDGTSASAASTNDASLDDEMPDAAYIEFTCSFAKRGSIAGVSGTATFAFTVVAGNGAALYQPQVSAEGNKCKVTVGDLKTHGGFGDFELVIDGTLTV